MNRNDLIAAVAAESGLSLGEAASAVSATLDAIARGVASEGSVSLPGFGVFEARERAARAGRNPQTGEAMQIAATRSPAFKPAAAFKRLVARD